MKITSAEKNKKHKDRLSVYVDGKFSFTISEEDYISLNLYEEQELTQEKIDYIKDTLNYRDAKARAVKFLSLKLRTEKEVRDKLRDEGYDDDCIEKVVMELKAIGYINNQLYAQKYIFDRSKLKPISKKLMKKELVFRGIPEEVADEVLLDWKVEDSSVAVNLLKRKFGKYDLSDKKVLKKAMAFLMHRGFSGDTIREALRDYNSDSSEYVSDPTDDDFSY